jgi:hypothetical protein
MAMLFLDLHCYGYVVGWIFGVWLFPFGLLVFRIGFSPPHPGVLLIIASSGYLADSLTPLLLPSYANTVGRFANIPLTLGEPRDNLVALLRARPQKDYVMGRVGPLSELPACRPGSTD